MLLKPFDNRGPDDAAPARSSDQNAAPGACSKTLKGVGLRPSPHYSREMRGQSQAVDIVHNYANGLFDEVFCNEISGPGVWWPGPISGGPMNYSG